MKINKYSIFQKNASDPNLQYKKMKASPVLTKRHQENRLKWCNERIYWDDEWSQIVWSDKKNEIYMDQMVLNSIGMTQE